MTMTVCIRYFIGALVLVLLIGGPSPASAQSRDSLLNGAIIGAAVGAGVGIGFTYAVRDSDLTAGQYAYGGAVWGAIGAGIGLGVDALFSRSSPRPALTRPGLLFSPAVGRVNGLTVKWRW
jgi:hypothetical protein